MTKTDLPSDVDKCQDLILELFAKLQEKETRIEDLLQRMNQLLRDRFGSKAERFDPGQLLLFAELKAAQDAAPSAVQVRQSTQPATDSHGRRQANKLLPRRREEYTLSGAELECPECGAERTKFGEEISEQYDYVPASVCVIQHVRFKYKCTPCQGNFVVAPAPKKVIDKGSASAGMLAYVATSKFADHQPLNRLEGIFKRDGAQIARSTMCDWIALTASILKPLWEHMRERILESRIIWTDDTPVKVQDREHAKNIRQGRLWVYLGDQRNPFTIFEFTDSRKRDGPETFLRNFKGFLQADAFAGYDCIYAGGEVLEVACMAHARRKFYDCLSSDRRAAEEMLSMIGELYTIERDGKSLSDEGRRKLRRAKAAPVLHKMCVWLRTNRMTTLPKSPLGKAITYATNNWRALCRYVADGELSIDNNASERAIRPVAVGRKNWLFAGSDEGGRNAAIIASFIQTCKQKNLNPRIYLKDVLTRLTSGEAVDLGELLPGTWVPST